MIVQNEVSTVERIGVKAESTFKIKTTAKAFRILSSGLYSDKITAIIRELSCNAYDSHVAANKEDKPFEIHLPNPIEPFFSIKDFGIGLSHKDVMTLYTTYFDSNKTDSNEYVGCLGLGSKSPFSYVDSFTVTSIFEGKKTVYNSFINEEGIPTIVPLGSENTKEHNGLEVMFSVTEKDFNEFKNKAAHVLRYFPVAPIINGNAVEVEKIKYVVKHPLWGTKINDGDGKKTYAIMGNVPYLVNTSDFENLEEYQDSILRYFNCDMFFKIGQLDVTPSREKLSYTEETRKIILERLKKIYQDIQVDIEKRIKDINRFWDACIVFDKINEEFSGLVKQINWKDKKIDRHTIIESSKEIKVIRRGGFRKPFDVIKQKLIKPSKNCVIYVADTNFAILKRADQVLSDKIERVYLIPQELVDEVCAKTGLDKNVDLKMWSSVSVPKVEREKRKQTVYVYNNSYNYSYRCKKRNLWNAEDDVCLTSLSGYYLSIDRYNIVYDGHTYVVDYMANDMSEIFKAIGMPTDLFTKEKVYGFNKAQMKIVKDNVNLKNLIDVVIAKIETKLMNDLGTNFITLYNSYKENMSDYNRSDFKPIQDILTGKIKMNYNALNKEIKEFASIYKYINLIEFLNKYSTSKMNIVTKNPSVKTVDFKKELFKRYPMLNLVSGYHYGGNKTDIGMLQEYIDLIDNTKELDKTNASV